QAVRPAPGDAAAPTAGRRAQARKPAPHGAREPVARSSRSPEHDPRSARAPANGGPALSAKVRYAVIGLAGLGLLILLVALTLGGKPSIDDKERAQKERPGGADKQPGAGLVAKAPQPTPEQPTGPPSVPPKLPDQPKTASTAPKTEPPVVKPAPARDGQQWRPVFDGRTLDCLALQGEGTWRVENGAICRVPGKDSAAQSLAEFADGEIRFRFETAGADFLRFCVRQGGAGEITAELSKTPGLAGKAHELVFRCEGADVSATLDGQRITVSATGRPLKGHLQFNASGGSLRVLAIEHR
ncbi:MAG: hypothetical protein NTW87_16120, partial [Planctomycetota bacterium]|nr:hypothetical protein [Planctomycetota bacterium]